MTYLQIKDKLTQLVGAEALPAVLELFTIANASTVHNNNLGAEARAAYYSSLRKMYPQTAKVTDADFDLIYNSGLPIAEKNKRLEKLGITIIEPKKPNQWQIFK